MARLDWLALAAVLGIALALRLVFYTGFFGSDEVTYIDMAARIAAGDWRASDYIGATRYGMNLPVALFIYLFGLTEFSANLWPMLCSLGEVALVFVMARWLWSTRAAVMGAGLLALLPIHIHFAGRMMADPPLAFFLTLSVALLLRTTATKSGITSLAAGLAWGGVFWVKESVGLLFGPVFLLIFLYLAGVKNQRLLLGVATGMFTALVANSLLMYLVADNPLHVFAVMKTAVVHLAGVTTLSESPWFYLRYLFMDIKHTFLLGFLVLIGFIIFIRNWTDSAKDIPAAQCVIVWILLLLGMFSFAIVSFSPIKLVMKQTNYMLIFVAPMALLAGWLMASLQRRVLMPLVALIIGGSVVLAALEQQAVTVFTANSRAAYVFLKNQPNLFLLGSANNLRAVSFYALIENRQDVAERMTSLANVGALSLEAAPSKLASDAQGKEVMALIDPQNISWGVRASTIKGVADIPSCWPARGSLTPAPLGAGVWVVQGLLAMGTVLPTSVQSKYLAALQPVAAVAPGLLFTVDTACSPHA